MYILIYLNVIFSCVIQSFRNYYNMLKKHLLLSMLKIAVLPFCEHRDTIFFLMNGKFKDTALIEIEYNIIEYYCVCIKKCYFLGQKLSNFYFFIFVLWLRNSVWLRPIEDRFVTPSLR